MSLLEEVRSTISRYKMLGKGDRVVTGVSGGADSVCLLRVLAGLREKYGLELSVVHVHHGIRGAEADRDARFTEELCGTLGIRCQVVYRDIPALAAREKCSEEEMGRLVRYEALKEYAGEHGCNRIAMAHNRDDHAETVIGNLCRGSGIAGLTGIPPVRGQIIRPLLFCTRAEIEEYLAELGQDYCTDSTNAGNDYTRNRIRHQILPLMETAVNRRTAEHIVETAEQLRQVEEYLTGQTAEQLERIVWMGQSKLPGELPDRAAAGSASASTGAGRPTSGEEQAAEQFTACEWLEADFYACPPVLAGRVVLSLAEALAGHRKNFTAVAVRMVLELFEKEVGKEASLPCGLRAVRTYGGVRLERQECTAPAGSEPVKRECAGWTEAGIDAQGCGKQKRAGRRSGEQATGTAGRQEYRMELSPDGRCEIKVSATGQIFLFERLDFSENGRIRSVCGREITFSSGKVVKIPESSCVKWFDYDKMFNTVVIRTRRPGDTICLYPERGGSTESDPTGGSSLQDSPLRGRKKLKSYLIDRKVPREERDGIWFLAEGSNVIWIPGERNGENYRIDESTVQILSVQII